MGGHNNLAEKFLEITRRNLPVVDYALAQHGSTSLSAYVEGLIDEPKPAYQSRSDLLGVIRRLAEPLLGESVAKQAVSDLEVSPLVLTANHHGVDSLAQSFQGNLIFSLSALSSRRPSNKTIIIFSCGSIPLNNFEYPRGLLLYHLEAGHQGLVRRFPIFPERLKRCMVGVTAGFDDAMITRAEQTLAKMLKEARLSAHIESSLRQLLREDYLAPSVIRLPRYSDQSVVLNHRIWRRLFSGPVAAPAMVNLEFEKIVAGLLTFDLWNQQSLAHRALFDPSLRNRVVAELDGMKGCWKLEKLAARLVSSGIQPDASQGCGTLFFWGVDSALRRIPLTLTNRGKLLCGVDDRGRSFEMPFIPKKIMEGIERGRLLPSLFTCYLTLSFARGVVCAGGYFQAEYLPAMQQGLVRALARTSGYQELSHFVARVPANRYLSGMLGLMTRVDGDCLIPVGPVEVLAAGGITHQDIERLSRVTLRDAHLAGLFETAFDAVPCSMRPPGWETQLAKDCCALLKNRVVLK